MRSLSWSLAAGLAVLVLSGCDGSDSAHGRGDDREPHGEAGGEHEGEGAEVVLTEEQGQAIGIETTRVGPGSLVLVLRVVAAVVVNLDTQVHVNPKVAGVVHKIHVGLGDAVKQGDPLCEIDSVELGNAVADYLKARAAHRSAEETLGRNRTLYEQRLETQQTVLDGAVEIAKAIFEREDDLRKRELTTMRPYLEAEKEYKQAQFDRERTLALLRAERDSRLLELEVAVRAGRVELDSAENRLHILGMEQAQVDALADEQGTGLGRFVIRAPTAGVVARRDATANEFASTETDLFRIDNLSRSWIEGAVYEKDLAAVRTGQQAHVKLNAFPDRTFGGTVTYVSHEIDTATRAARVRIEVDNKPIPEWPEPYPIRHGMFGTAEIAVGSFAAGIVVPLTAIARDGAREFVFVREGPRTFVAKDIKIGRRAGDRAEVVAGLDAGMEVAVSGTFELRSLLQKEKLGGGDSH